MTRIKKTIFTARDVRRSDGSDLALSDEVILNKNRIEGANRNLMNDEQYMLSLDRFITLVADQVPTLGEANQAANIGTAEGVFAQKNGQVLEFKSIREGTGMLITSDANEITIENNGVLGVSDVGTGQSLHNLVNGNNLQLRTLNEGAGVVLTQEIDGSITIESASAAPAGADREIQFNDNGVFGASEFLRLDTQGNIIVSNAFPVIAETQSVVITNAGGSDSDNLIAFYNTSNALVTKLFHDGTGFNIEDTYLQINETALNTASLVASKTRLIADSGDLGKLKQIASDGTVYDLTAGGGESNTASNQGSGIGLFIAKNNVDLQFKSLVAGANITLNDNGDSVEISTGGSVGEANDANNIGGGAGVYSNKTGVDINLRSIVGAGPVSASVVGDTIQIDSAGEANTASNLGSAFGIFAQKSGDDLQFKSLRAGTNVTITQTATEITVNAAAGGGGSNPVSRYAEFVDNNNNGVQFPSGSNNNEFIRSLTILNANPYPVNYVALLQADIEWLPGQNITGFPVTQFEAQISTQANILYFGQDGVLDPNEQYPSTVQPNVNLPVRRKGMSKSRGGEIPANTSITLYFGIEATPREFVPDASDYVQLRDIRFTLQTSI